MEYKNLIIAVSNFAKFVVNYSHFDKKNINQIISLLTVGVFRMIRRKLYLIKLVKYALLILDYRINLR